MTALRAVAAVIAGMLVAFVLVIAVELFSALVHPFPPGFGGTKEEICQHVERYPQWVLAVAVVAWGATVFISTWTAKRISGRGSALVVGFLLFAAVAFNLSMLPYPIWFKIANLLVFPAAIGWGSRNSRTSVQGKC